MIRPLLISPSSTGGGAEAVLLTLAARLGPGFSPRGLVLADGPLAGRLRERGIPTEVEPLVGKLAVLRYRSTARSLAGRLSREGVSLVHANGTKGALFGLQLARRLGVPLLWHKHGHDFDSWSPRLLGPRCDLVACVTGAVAARFPASMRDRVRVVHNGVELSALSDAAASEPLVACLGRLDPAKGLADVIGAIAVLRDAGTEARLEIAGEPDRLHPGHREELERITRDLDLGGRVRLLGVVEDPASLYGRARVVALASRARRRGAPSEGAPLVLLEAMSHGRPVVAPQEPGIAEIVGEAGTLTPDLSPAGLAEALRPYLEDPARAAEVGRRGRARVAAGFTVEHMVRSFEDIYRELARVSVPAMP